MKQLTKQQEKECLESLTILQEQLQQSLQQINESAQPVNLDQQAFGRVSRGDALQQQSMAKANLTQIQKRLKQVLQALARVDNNDYGCCLDCDNAIGYPRLQARPETPLCINCQNKAENGGL